MENNLKGIRRIHLCGKRSASKRSLLAALLLAHQNLSSASPPTLVSWTPEQVMTSIAEDVVTGLVRDVQRKAERVAKREIGHVMTPFPRRYEQELRAARRAISPGELQRYLERHGHSLEGWQYRDRRAIFDLAANLYVVAGHEGSPQYFQEAMTRVEIATGKTSAALLHLRLADERNEVQWPKGGETDRALWVYRTIERLYREGFIEYSPRYSQVQQNIEKLYPASMALEPKEEPRRWRAIYAVLTNDERDDMPALDHSHALDHLAWTAMHRGCGYASILSSLAAMAFSPSHESPSRPRAKSRTKEEPVHDQELFNSGPALEEQGVVWF